MELNITHQLDFQRENANIGITSNVDTHVNLQNKSISKQSIEDNQQEKLLENKITLVNWDVQIENLTGCLRLDADGKPYVDESFDNSSLTIQSVSQNGFNPCSCIYNFCKKEFAKQDDLTSHLKEHTDGKEYSCYDCGQKFDRKSDIIGHFRKFHVEKIECNYCTETFLQKSELAFHLKMHTREAYACNYCNKRFSQKHSLTAHLKMHGYINPYTCDNCEKAYNSIHSLRLHARVHTKDPHICDQCSGQFFRERDLIDHLKIHHGIEKGYICDYCGKKFTFMLGLKRHSMLHTGEKPYACMYCKKQFADSSALHFHLRRHTGYKPHSCDYCPKSFIRKSELIVHLRRHTGEKPYVCNRCDKKFSQKCHLTGHLKMHTIDK